MVKELARKFYFMCYLKNGNQQLGAKNGERVHHETEFNFGSGQRGITKPSTLCTEQPQCPAIDASADAHGDQATVQLQ